MRFLNVKRIKPRLLIVHIIVTALYPAARAFFSPAETRMRLLSDSLTIIGALLLVFGVIYQLYLLGDFDVSAYALKRGFKRRGPEVPLADAQQDTFEAYVAEKKEKRLESFNYSLFLGAIYLLISLFIALALV